MDWMLRQRAEIRRMTAGESDRYGNAKYTATQVDVNVPCRVVESRRRRIDPNSGEWAWLMETHILFGGGADVQRGDDVIVDGIVYRARNVVLRRDAWGAARLVDVEADALA